MFYFSNIVQVLKVNLRNQLEDKETRRRKGKTIVTAASFLCDLVRLVRFFPLDPPSVDLSTST